MKLKRNVLTLLSNSRPKRTDKIYNIPILDDSQPRTPKFMNIRYFIPFEY